MPLDPLPCLSHFLDERVFPHPGLTQVIEGKREGEVSQNDRRYKRQKSQGGHFHLRPSVQILDRFLHEKINKWKNGNEESKPRQNVSTDGHHIDRVDRQK